MQTVSYTTSLDALPAVFFLTNTKGEIVYANARIEERTGFQVPEVIGKRPGDLWGGRMPRAFYKELWETIQLRERPFVGEARNQKKNGEEYAERIHLAPVYDADGKARYFLAMNPLRADSYFASFFPAVMRDTRKNAQAFFDSVRFFGSSPSAYRVTRGDSLAAVFEEMFVIPMRERLRPRNDDATLIYEAKKNRAAFEELYAKYQKQIYEYLYHRLSRDRALAEDLTQETFVKAFSHLDSFESSNASYLTYLRRIAHNLFVDYLRKYSAAPSEPMCVEASFLSSEMDMTTMYEGMLLERSMDVLSGTEEMIIRMKYLDQLSVREIASELGKTENAVKLHLSRGREKLRKQMVGEIET